MKYARLNAPPRLLPTWLESIPFFPRCRSAIYPFLCEAVYRRVRFHFFLGTYGTVVSFRCFRLRKKKKKNAVLNLVREFDSTKLMLVHPDPEFIFSFFIIFGIPFRLYLLIFSFGCLSHIYRIVGESVGDLYDREIDAASRNIPSCD